MPLTRVKHTPGGPVESGMLDPPLGTAALLAESAFLKAANNLSELTATAATARTNLGLGTSAVKDVKAGAAAVGLGTAEQVIRFGDAGTGVVKNVKAGAAAVGAGAAEELARFGDLGSAAYKNVTDFVQNVSNPPVLYVRPSPTAGQFGSIAAALDSIKNQFVPQGAYQTIDIAGTFGAHPPFVINNDRTIILASAATILTMSPTLAGITVNARDVSIVDINLNIATSCTAGIISNAGGVLTLSNVNVTRTGGTVGYGIAASESAAQILCTNGGSVSGCANGYYANNGATVQISGKAGGCTYTVSNCTTGLGALLGGRILLFTGAGSLPLTMNINGTCTTGVSATNAAAIDLNGSVAANSGTTGYEVTMNAIIANKGASPGSTSISTGGQIS